MDIKYLSRKFLLSVTLAVIATIFIWAKLIQPYQWQWVIMATAVSYVAANTLSKKTETSAADNLNGVTFAGVPRNAVTWWERIKSLFSREFLVCMGTVIVASMLLISQRIGSDVWFTICSALAVAYNIGNAVSKL